MKTWRITAVVLMLCFLTGFPVFSQGSEEAGEQTEKLVFMFPYDVNSPVTEWHQENLDLFVEAHENVEMDKINSSTGDEYLTQVTTMMASGEAIDILQGWTLARMEPFAEAGRLMDLKPVFDADPDFKNFVQEAPLKATSFNGGIYGIPLELAVEGIFYNKAIFAEAGVDVPETYQEFLEAITAIRDAGYIPIALGNTDAWIGTIPYMMLVDRIGGMEVYEKTVMEGTGSWTEEPFIEAAYELQKWMEMGAFEPNVNGIPAVEGIARFQNREAAMFFMGSWSLPAFYQDLGDDLGFFNLPAMADGKGSDKNWIIIPNQSISLSAATEYKDTAVEFLKFAFSPERQEELAKSGLIVTTNVELDPEDVNPLQVEIIDALGKAEGSIYPWDVPLGSTLGGELNNTTRSFYDGADPEQALERLQQITDAERQSE